MRPEARAVLVGKKAIHEVSALSVRDAQGYFAKLKLSKKDKQIAERIERLSASRRTGKRSRFGREGDAGASMVRVYYSLYDRMLSLDNLRRGFKKVKSSRGAAGMDGQTVDDFGEGLEVNLAMLARELREKSYSPQPVKRVEIPKPDGGVRLLGIPAVRDRVAQQALLDILQPIFDPEFHPSSYG